MAKISKSYLDVDTFKIIETGFHPDRAEVSEYPSSNVDLTPMYSFAKENIDSLTSARSG